MSALAMQLRPSRWRLAERIGNPPAAAALALYAIGALVLFGAPLFRGGHACLCISHSSDVSVLLWSFEWWPHALVHGLNPFDTHILYAPDGFNLAHAQLAPGAALALAPVTAIAGPLFAFNLAMLLSPVLAAFFAFLLCRRLTRAFWPSVLGGWLFGFSTYMLGPLTSHLNLTLVFLLPAITHLVLRRYAGEIVGWRFVGLLVIALVLQFLFSPEVFLSFTLFAGVTLVVACVLGGVEARARIRAMLGSIVLAYVVAAVIFFPYLYYASKPGAVPVLLSRTANFSADLLSFFLPTPMTAIGGQSFLSITHTFRAGPPEAGVYLGLPLIAMVFLSARSGFRRREVRVMVTMLLVVGLCTLGPRLEVEGKLTGMRLPWGAAWRLPLLGQMLPVRFVVYLFLIAAMLSALWLAGGGEVSLRSRLGRAALATAAVVLLLPAAGSHWWNGSEPVPSLFSSGASRRIIGSRDVVFAPPVGNQGLSMYWQAEARLRFTMAGGYVVPPEAPDPYKRDPAYRTLTLGLAVPNLLRAAASFLSSHRVTVAVVDPSNQFGAPWIGILTRLGWRGFRTGGVVIFRLRSPA